MNRDPYTVLGVSPAATDDEVKKAYRALARKHHPDHNGGSAESEAKMREINEAYSQVMAMRKGGNSGNSYGAGGPGAQGGYGQSGYGGQRQQGGYDPFGGNPFGGFGGFGGFGYGGQGQGQGQRQSASPDMQKARNFINMNRWEDASIVLSGMQNRDAEWYYLSALAQRGLGNQAEAFNYARQAVQMDPYRMEYRELLSSLQGASGQYRTFGQGQFGGFPQMLCQNPCMTLCLVNALCNCCCNMGSCSGYSRRW